MSETSSTAPGFSPPHPRPSFRQKKSPFVSPRSSGWSAAVLTALPRQAGAGRPSRRTPQTFGSGFWTRAFTPFAARSAAAAAASRPSTKNAAKRPSFLAMSAASAAAQATPHARRGFRKRVPTTPSVPRADVPAAGSAMRLRRSCAATGFASGFRTRRVAQTVPFPYGISTSAE